MKTVEFTRMDRGTKGDYALLEARNRITEADVATQVLSLLVGLKGPESGYQIDRLQHSLQTATRAERDGADEEAVVCALLHDIGDTLAPANHAQFAAEVLRPFVSPENCWVVAKHGIFQGYYFWHHLGYDRNAREKFRDHPCFERTEYFCENWDQQAFDPGYDTLQLAHFEPAVRRLFAREPYSEGRGQDLL
jgi:predicted HD phosphohydrolase